MLLATHEFGEPHLGGWFLGLGIGFAVVLVVVVVVATILALATRVGARVQGGLDALEVASSTAQPLEELSRTPHTLQSILRGAQHARRGLEQS